MTVLYCNATPAQVQDLRRRMTAILGEHLVVVDTTGLLDAFYDAVVCMNGTSHAPSQAAACGIPVWAVTNSGKIRNTFHPLQEIP